MEAVGERWRADTVGSLRRPAYLWAARDALAVGSLTTAEFKAIEDRRGRPRDRAAGGEGPRRRDRWRDAAFMFMGL